MTLLHVLYSVTRDLKRSSRANHDSSGMRHGIRLAGIARAPETAFLDEHGGQQ
jgi:hypothetical protein